MTRIRLAVRFCWYLTHDDNLTKPVLEVNTATGSGLYALDGGDGLIKIDADNIKIENIMKEFLE